MPQVNEFSWLSTSYKFLLIFLMFLFSLSYYVLDQKISSQKLNIIYFSYLN